MPVLPKPVPGVSGRGVIPKVNTNASAKGPAFVGPAGMGGRPSQVNPQISSQSMKISQSNADFTISMNTEGPTRTGSMAQLPSQFQTVQNNYARNIPQPPVGAQTMQPNAPMGQVDSGVNFNQLGNQQVSINENNFKMEQATPGVGGGAYSGAMARGIGGGPQYGFNNMQNQANARGSLIVMRAAKNDGVEASGDENKDTAGNDTDIEVTPNEKAELVKAGETEEKNADGVAKFKPVYAYFVLFMALFCRIMVQWHRKGITYAYGYTGLGEFAGNPIYEISSAYPQLKNWYGLLAGVVYTIPYAGFGLVVGKLSDTANRKLWLGIMVILASLTMGISGFVNSFAVLAIMRVFHGAFNSATNPLSFSLVSDYFPPDRRATANSIIQAGNYIGVGASSLSIILISSFGWRVAYGVMAALGMVGGLATMLFVREPERGRFLDNETKKKEAEKKKKAEEEAAKNKGKNPIKAFFENIGLVFSLPCARNTLIASSLRNFGGMCVSSFLPVFFGKVFPAFKAEYALLNAAALSICGLLASIGGGVIADKFEKKSYMTKAFLCIFGCLLSVPLIALGTLQDSNFYLGVACYALKVLVSGTYSGPAITMIQNTSPASQQGNVVSVYFTCITIAQTISPVLFGWLANSMGALANPTLYGPILTGIVALSYWGSIPFWWKAGKYYK